MLNRTCALKAKLANVLKLEPTPHSLERCAHGEKFRAEELNQSLLTPEMKSFVDRILVPILVKSYIEMLESEKSNCGK